MLERDWDDDSDYRSAVRRTRIMMVLAAVVALCGIGVGVVALFDVWLFVGLVTVRIP